MTSVGSQYSQIPANKLYINVVSVASTIVDAKNVKATWVTPQAVASVLATPGAAVFRDMGKNVFLPDPNVPTVVGAQSTILRKVQLVVAPVGGTGQSSDASYYTGYIRLGGQTYGGGDAVPTGVARLN